jgi:hypothetical protein
MHISRAKRSAAARKAAHTRARNKAKRRTIALKAARTRRRKGIVAAKMSIVNRSPAWHG